MGISDGGGGGDPQSRTSRPGGEGRPAHHAHVPGKIHSALKVRKENFKLKIGASWNMGQFGLTPTHPPARGGGVDIWVASHMGLGDRWLGRGPSQKFFLLGRSRALGGWQSTAAACRLSPCPCCNAHACRCPSLHDFLEALRPTGFFMSHEIGKGLSC